MTPATANALINLHSACSHITLGAKRREPCLTHVFDAWAAASACMDAPSDTPPPAPPSGPATQADDLTAELEHLRKVRDIARRVVHADRIVDGKGWAQAMNELRAALGELME